MSEQLPIEILLIHLELLVLEKQVVPEILQDEIGKLVIFEV